jgi:ribose-phosphate pyrophosphokinase
MLNIKLFSGNATPELAKDIARNLDIPLGKCSVERFSDGEIKVSINENVRGRNVFIIQSTCNPTNDNLMELIIMTDALRRASAASITAVIPYFGYARQDRRVRSARVPITAKVVADMISSSGITHVITADLHADQIQGFFSIPVDNTYASHAMLDIKTIIETHPNLTIVSPDVGGVVRARAIAKRLGDADLAIIDKRRAKANQSEVMNIIGDVKGRNCIIMDDIVDTAGTLIHAAAALKHAGAISVEAFCVHPVLSGNALTNIEKSSLDKLIVSDSIPLSKQAQECSKITVTSLSRILAETISRIEKKASVSSLFTDDH